MLQVELRWSPVNFSVCKGESLLSKMILPALPSTGQHLSLIGPDEGEGVDEITFQIDKIGFFVDEPGELPIVELGLKLLGDEDEESETEVFGVLTRYFKWKGKE